MVKHGLLLGLLIGCPLVVGGCVKDPLSNKSHVTPYDRYAILRGQQPRMVRPDLPTNDDRQMLRDRLRPLEP